MNYIINYSFNNDKSIEYIKNNINSFMENYEFEKIIIHSWLICEEKKNGIIIVESTINDIKKNLLKYFDDIKIDNYSTINEWLN